MASKGFTIAVSGKGGTGKTTVAALLIRALTSKGSVLAVDADPNSNLHEALGMELGETVGGIREEALTKSIPAGMSKGDFFDYRIQKCLVEGEVDLLSIGRPEGPGCYCYANNLIKQYTDALADSYDYVVMDCEAGLEHLSRRTSRAVDVLLIVSDASKVALKTAEHISQLADEIKLGANRVALIVNRSDKESKTSLQVIEVIPFDKKVEGLSIEGKPLTSLPKNSPAFLSVNKLIGKLT